ncbi:MAG: carboxymuconolactone decarboxylase family protein [Vicinamibacterales bacterium]
MGETYTMTLRPRTVGDAGATAAPILEEARNQLGFVPNMYAVMANSPGALRTYLDGYNRFRKDSGFGAVEQEVVFLTISRSNGCEYCMAAHSTIADLMSKVPPEVTAAIREGQAIPDARLAALAQFTDVMLDSRGRPSPAAVATFLAAGYEERHVLEIILAIAVKTISNYSNHVFHTPVDGMFAERSWTHTASV